MHSSLKESAHAMLQEGKASVSINPIHSADDLHEYSMSIVKTPTNPAM